MRLGPSKPGAPKGTRGRIIDLLRRSGLTANELAARLGLTHNAVRGHLAVLQWEGLVREGGARRSGTRPAVVYELAPEAEAGFSSAYIPFVAQLVRMSDGTAASRGRARKGRMTGRESVRLGS